MLKYKLYFKIRWETEEGIEETWRNVPTGRTPIRDLELKLENKVHEN